MPGSAVSGHVSTGVLKLEHKSFCLNLIAHGIGLQTYEDGRH